SLRRSRWRIRQSATPPRNEPGRRPARHRPAGARAAGRPRRLYRITITSGMAVEENRVVVRRFIDEVFVKGNADAVDKLVTADFTPHSWGTMSSGIEPLKQAIARVRAGLSEVSMKIDDMIAEDDKIAVRLTAHGKHQGDFMGLPASG